MRKFLHIFTCAVAVLFGVAHVAVAGQPAAGLIRGVVSDDSGAVMPGVSVTATSAAGVVLASATTDAVGVYTLEGLPSGNFTVAFQLDGFAAVAAAVLLEPGAERTLSPRLLLAPLKEDVVVVGRAPVDPPKRRPAPPPPPPPVILPVVQHDRDSICGPAKPDGASKSFGTIQARRGTAENGLYAKGDQLLVDGGTDTGLEVGENYAVRRLYRVDGARVATLEHTSGLLQIVSAKERDAVAVVVYACDAFMPGDILGRFRPEPIRAPEPLGVPAFDNAAKILFADIGQLLGVERRLMVIDRGVSSDLRVGQALTIFRSRGKRSPLVLGEAVIVAIRKDSATIRVERATDDISFGDWAAPQRYPVSSAGVVSPPSNTP
jgi:hypothetical protein